MKMKKALSLIASLSLLCALLLPVPVSVSAAENLAVNGDLEMGSTNGWDIDAAVMEPSVVHSGSYSLKLTATDAWVGAAYKAVPVRKNATVTVSFYYRYASSPGSQLYHVYTYKGADPWTGAYSTAEASFTANSSTYATWQKASYTFNSGDYDSIYLKFCPAAAGSVPCYIDDLVVTSVGGDEPDVEPYLTSFGTKNNRPKDATSNLIVQGGFESGNGAQWNGAAFVKGNLSVVADSDAVEGNNVLYFDSGNTTAPAWHTFPVAVERNTRYTFSAWVKSPRLSDHNRATATFGVMNAATGEFLVYEPYNGNGHGAASLSTATMQLMASAPDGEWHLRSVTFDSGSHTTVYVGVYGAESQLYLDDLALFKSSNGVEYISPLRTETISGGNTGDNRYCADEDSLIKGIHMTSNDARLSWSDNPAWRNGFLSFADVGESHGAVLKYTASDHTEWQLHYIDWIDVKPNTSYTLTLDVKCLAAGGGRIALLDDNILAPAEFYTISFDSADSDWVTYSVTFDSGVYSRVGFAIVDGGGAAYMDKIRLFKTADGIATEPEDVSRPTLLPQGGPTSVADMEGMVNCVTNGDFESGSLWGYDVYQSTVLSADAAHSGEYGAHLRGDGSWGAMLEQVSVPVVDGQTYTLSYWYKANASGTNVMLKGKTTNTQYAYAWAADTAWTYVTAEFTVEGDTELVFNACGGGNGVAEDVYMDDIVLLNIDEIRLGVAFFFDLEADGIRMDEKHIGNLYYATVDAYGDGTRYPLKKMGAVMTNDATVGESRSAFTLEHPAMGLGNVVDIPAVYLWSVSDAAASYAVRIINVPWSHKDTPLYARPYYVFEKNGEEIVVYGAIYNRSYADASGSMPF